MNEPLTPSAITSALQYVIGSDIPSEHRAVLIEALTQALRDEQTAHLRDQVAKQAGGTWQAHEVAQLQSFLEGKQARSWQQADEVLMHLATQLHRSREDVRAKAVELGYAASVDFRIAKAHAQRVSSDS
jgi:hypothetical protein